MKVIMAFKKVTVQYGGCKGKGKKIKKTVKRKRSKKKVELKKLMKTVVASKRRKGLVNKWVAL